MIEWCGDENFPLLVNRMPGLPLADAGKGAYGQVMRILTGFRLRNDSSKLVRRALSCLEAIPALQLADSSLSLLCLEFPREAFEFFRNRIRRFEALADQWADAPLPYFRRLLDLSNLRSSEDFESFANELWENAVTNRGIASQHWGILWQWVVIHHDDIWKAKIRNAIPAARSERELRCLTDLLEFGGSRIVYRVPEITEAVLGKAHELGGRSLLKQFQHTLYSGSGPTFRCGTNGVLNEECDYLEAEAAKALEKNAGNPVLSEFYQFVIESERESKARDLRAFEVRLESD